MEDAELIAQAARGDGAAFAVFYRRHLDTVVAYLRRRVREPEQAFDLTAETFAAAALSAGRFRADEGPAIAWLLGIARNKLRESLRRGRVEDSARRRLGAPPVELEDPDIVAVEDRAEAGAAPLEQALDSLPEATRSVLLARVVDEQSYEEIAARLGCSQQVVRQRVSRGLAALRTSLEEHG